MMPLCGLNIDFRLCIAAMDTAEVDEQPTGAELDLLQSKKKKKKKGSKSNGLQIQGYVWDLPGLCYSSCCIGRVIEQDTPSL